MIYAGSTIVCPRCGKPVGQVLNDLSAGSFVSAEDIDATPKYEQDDRMISRCCSELWFVDGSLSLENGWYPRRPQPKPFLAFTRVFSTL